MTGDAHSQGLNKHLHHHRSPARRPTAHRNFMGRERHKSDIGQGLVSDSVHGPSYRPSELSEPVLYACPSADLRGGAQGHASHGIRNRSKSANLLVHVDEGKRNNRMGMKALKSNVRMGKQLKSAGTPEIGIMFSRLIPNRKKSPFWIRRRGCPCSGSGRVIPIRRHYAARRRVVTTAQSRERAGPSNGPGWDCPVTL